jgi:hypothetical protein
MYVCDCEALKKRRPWPSGGWCAMKKTYCLYSDTYHTVMLYSPAPYGGTSIPQTAAQHNQTVNMRGSLSRQMAQLQGNGVKILMCYRPLVQILLVYSVTTERNAIA